MIPLLKCWFKNKDKLPKKENESPTKMSSFLEMMIGAGDPKTMTPERRLSFAEKLKRKMSSGSKNDDEDESKPEEDYLSKFVDINVAYHCFKILVLVINQSMNEIPREFIEDLIEFQSSECGQKMKEIVAYIL